MIGKAALLCAFVLVTCPVVSSVADKVVCYFRDWSDDPNIPSGLCTHLIFSFATLNDVTFGIDGNNERYERLIAMKKKDGNVKVMLAIGGWNDRWKQYGKMISTSANRAKFINSVMQHVQNNGFDGIDLDWEYPAAADKTNFGLLCKELKRRLGNKLLTAAVYANLAYDKGTGYDTKMMATYLDFINVMTYDLRGPWHGRTGNHGSQKPRSEDSRSLNDFTVESSMKSWLAKVPARKLVVGIPTYGRYYKLINPSNNDIGAPTTKQGSSKDYNIICTEEKYMTIRRDPSAIAPYAFRGTDWVGYDDPISAHYKGAYAKQNGFGGVMFWAVGGDDVDGSCGHGTYPIIRNATAGMKSQLPMTPPVIAPPQTKAPKIMVTKAPVTEEPEEPEEPVVLQECTAKNSMFCNPTNPKQFYWCVSGYKHTRNAPSGTVCVDTSNGVQFVHA